jgi:hypothetical protein
MIVLFACLTEKNVTFKGNKSTGSNHGPLKLVHGVIYKLDPTETRAADHYHQAQFDNTGSKKDRIGGLQRIANPIIPGKFEM